VILTLAILLIIFASPSLGWDVVILAVACVLEIFEISILRRWSKRIDRRTKRTTGSEAMVGEHAQVVEPCHPTGTVHLRGELWKARCEGGADTGDTVEVKAVEGLTLVVAR